MKRNIISTIVIILITMLLIPLIIVNYFEVGIAWRLIFYFLVYPVEFWVLGIISGTDVRRLWWISTLAAIVFPPLFCVAIKENGFYLYIFSAIYFAIGMTTMLVTLAIKSIIIRLKTGRTKKEMEEIEKKIRINIIKWKVINILSVIMIIISVLMLAYSYFMDRYELKLNEEDKKIIEEIQIRAKESWEYTSLVDLTNVYKIRWYFEFNNNEYTYYYNDGTVKEVYNDHIYELREYIQENGKIVGTETIYILILSIAVCIFASLNIIGNEDKLYFYKEEYNKNTKKE